MLIYVCVCLCEYTHTQNTHTYLYILHTSVYINENVYWLILNKLWNTYLHTHTHTHTTTRTHMSTPHAFVAILTPFYSLKTTIQHFIVLTWENTNLSITFSF